MDPSFPNNPMLQAALERARGSLRFPSPQFSLLTTQNSLLGSPSFSAPSPTSNVVSVREVSQVTIITSTRVVREHTVQSNLIGGQHVSSITENATHQSQSVLSTAANPLATRYGYPGIQGPATVSSISPRNEGRGPLSNVAGILGAFPFPGPIFNPASSVNPQGEDHVALPNVAEPMTSSIQPSPANQATGARSNPPLFDTSSFANSNNAGRVPFFSFAGVQGPATSDGPILNPASSMNSQGENHMPSSTVGEPIILSFHPLPINQVRAPVPSTEGNPGSSSEQIRQRKRARPVATDQPDDRALAVAGTDSGERPIVRNGRSYKCTRCDKEFDKSQSYAAHMGSHYSKEETKEQRDARRAAKCKRVEEFERVCSGDGPTVIPRGYLQGHMDIIHPNGAEKEQQQVDEIGNVEAGTSGNKDDDEAAEEENTNPSGGEKNDEAAGEENTNEEAGV